MAFFPSRTIFIQIGPVNITWYAMLIVTGAFAAYYFAKKNLKEYRNIELNGFLDDVFIYMLWGGIIGARLWYCLFDSTTNYLENPAQIIRIWDGGLAFHGGFIAGIVVCYFFCKKRNVSFIKFADSIFPTVLLGQAFGRWGNFVNQECFGPEVDETFYNGILSFLKDGMYIGGAYRTPCFFYESVLCLLGFIIINFILKKYQNKRGDLSWAYLIWYGVIRFFIEGLRTDSLLMNVSKLKTAQVTSIVFVVIGLLGYVGVMDKVFKKKKPTIIFDLDGTLQDSEKPIQLTYKELYRRHDKEENFTDEIATEILGPGLLEMFPKLFPNEDPNALFNEYQEINKDILHQYLKPMPNTLETLKALKEEGYNIGIVTTRTKKSTENCLNLTGMKDLIDDVCGMDDVKKLKPNPEAYGLIIDRNRWNKDDIIVIGDSTADINGGKNYGAYTIGYLFNENKKQQVIDAKPDKIISDIKELLDIVKEKHYFTYNGK